MNIFIVKIILKTMFRIFFLRIICEVDNDHTTEQRNSSLNFYCFFCKDNHSRSIIIKSGDSLVLLIELV